MRAALLLAFVVCAAAACGGRTDAAADGMRFPSDLTGLIVAIDGKGPNVQGFTLESGGERYEIGIAADADYGFDLAHLREHMNERLPVRCILEERNGQLVALEILDAPVQ